MTHIILKQPREADNVKNFHFITGEDEGIKLKIFSQENITAWPVISQVEVWILGL